MPLVYINTIVLLYLEYLVYQICIPSVYYTGGGTKFIMPLVYIISSVLVYLEYLVYQICIPSVYYTGEGQSSLCPVYKVHKMLTKSIQFLLRGRGTMCIIFCIEFVQQKF